MAHRALLVGCGVLLLLELGVAFAAPLIASRDPLSHHPEARFMPPGSPSFPLGTDNHGRDLLSRVLFGARATFITAAVAVGVAAVCGITIGTVSAVSHHFIDAFLDTIVNVVLAFPLVIVVLLLVSTLGEGLFSLGLALGIGFTPLFARYFRLETRALLQQNFVLSAIAIGAGTLYIVRAHILVSLLPKVVIQIALNIVLIISVGTALSFLGFGATPPAADWGLMLRDARSYIHTAPWMALIPGGALLLTNVLFQVFAELLSRHLQPK